MKSYRKFGIAGLIVFEATQSKAWWVAVTALAIYSVANLIERWMSEEG